MNQFTVPDYLQGRGAGRAAQITQESTHGMGAPPVPFISIEGNRFTLVDASGTDFPVPTMGPIMTTVDAAGNQVGVQGSPVGHYLDCVLVDVNPEMSKVYFPDPYSPNQQNYLPPSCWSDNGVAPSTAALKPQALKCELCPHNVWGSKINALGNKVKACDDVRKMGFYVPFLAERGIRTVFLLRLKGSSFRNWSNYADQVSKQRFGDRPMQVTDLITRIYFDQGDGKNVGILAFSWAGLVDRASAMLQQEVWDNDGCNKLLGLSDQPISALPAGWTPPQIVAGSPQQPEQPAQRVAPPPIPQSQPAAMRAATPPQPVWNAAKGVWELPATPPAPAAPPPTPVFNPQTGQWELPGQPVAELWNPATGAWEPAAVGAAQQPTQAPANGRRGPRGGRKAAAALQASAAATAPAPAAAPPTQTQTAAAPASFQPGQMPDLPGFLRRGGGGAVAPGAQPVEHGMQQPAAPNPDVAAAINAALNPVPVPR